MTTPTGPTLADLLRTAKGTGTWEDLANRMPIDPRTNDRSPTYRTLMTIIGSSRKSLAFPDPDTIRAIATATGYTEQTIIDAAARTLGLRVDRHQTPIGIYLPAGSDLLTDEEVRSVVAIVRSLIANRIDHPDTGPIARTGG